MSTLPESKGMSARARAALCIAVGIGVLLLWQPLSKLLFQVALGLLLTAAALPISKYLEKKMPRPLAAMLAVCSLILFFIGILILFVPHIVEQIKLIIASAPRLLQYAQGLWTDIEQSSWFKQLGVNTGAPQEWLGTLGTWLGEKLPYLLTWVGTSVDAVSRAFLAPVLSYYFIRDRETFGYYLSLWIPLKHRRQALTALREMGREVGGYMRGQLLVSLCVGVLTAIGLLIVGIPAWLVLGLVMGIFELIPYVGPLLGAIPIALFSLPLGITTLLWGLFVAIAVQQLEGSLISPKLMAGATGLHPVYVMLLLSAGGLVGGLMGMLLALPAFVCLRGAVRVLTGTRLDAT